MSGRRNKLPFFQKGLRAMSLILSSCWRGCHPVNKDIKVPVPVPVPLECALGSKSKEYLSGVGNQRNTSMAVLARDLLGTEAEFRHLGEMTNDGAYTLYIDTCRRCSSGGGWSQLEWEQIWASAVKSSPRARICKAASDAVENCIRAWYRKNHLKCSINDRSLQNTDNSSATALVNSATAVVSSNLEAEIDGLLTQDLKESQVQIKILGLAQKYRTSSKELLKVY